jgi:hypothetical protein
LAPGRRSNPRHDRQFVFPTAAGVHFLRRGRRFEAAICAVWFGENLLYTARYLGDARAMALPMVGGEIHDWNWLLTRWGLLDQCETLARAVHLAGIVVVIGAIAYAGRIPWREWRVREPSGTRASRGPAS